MSDTTDLSKMTPSQLLAFASQLQTANAAKQEELKAEADALREENSRLQKQAMSKVTVKAGVDKETGKLTGTVSVYGINAVFPASQYPEGWSKIFSVEEEIKRVCALPEVVAAAAASKARKQAERANKANS